MKLKNRVVPLAGLPGKIVMLLRLLSRLFMLKRPLAMLGHYVARTSPGLVEFRSGLRIQLSSHPHDIVTAFVVFLKKDYGEIRRGSVVLDIGANIGAFALYASAAGAKRVYAFEPSQEAFDVLCENVRINNLDAIIVPVNKAVSDVDGQRVRFPARSSPYNRLGLTAEAALDECLEVGTVTVSTFMRDNGIGHVDLMKMDCEGAEFAVLPSMGRRELAAIDEIRMECHGSPDALIAQMGKEGFAVRRKRGMTVWLGR